MSVNKKFLNSIKRGTGEAYLLSMKYPNIDFSNEIIDGATTNYAYDAQCEGSRGEYIYGLIMLSKQKDKIFQQIIKEFKLIENDTYGLDQLYDILCLFAINGNKIAEKNIVERFELDCVNDFWEAEKSILIMFQIEGFRLIIEKKGKLHLELGDEYNDNNLDYLIDNYQQQNSNINVLTELEKYADNNKFVKIYLNKYKAHKLVVNPSSEKSQLDYSTISDKIRNRKFFFIDENRIKENDISRLAGDFLKETDKKMLENYLVFFSTIKFSHGYNYIFDILKTSKSNRNRFLDNVIDALSFFKNSELREYALEKLSEGKEFEIYSNLLIKNYEHGDGQILSKAARLIRNQDRLHTLLCSYIDIFRANKTKECKEPLEILYNKITCGFHRQDIIEILLENNVFSSKLIEEIQYDCDENIRNIYADIKASISVDN
jgi:hypothetical protein